MKSSSALALAFSLVALVGCDPQGFDTDAGRDSGSDAARDASGDAARDAGRDAARDTGTDAARDVNAPQDVIAPEDAVGEDAAEDVVAPDAEVDAGVDAAADVVVSSDGSVGGSCTLALQGTLNAPTTSATPTTVTATLNSAGYTSRIASVPNCMNSTTSVTMSTPGEEHIYALTVTTPGTYTLLATGEYVPTVAVRSGACTDESSQLVCGRINTRVNNMQASQAVATLAVGTYYLVLDRVSSLEGPYTLTITLQ